ncbi:hypothetical protein Gotur_000964 [Gossypium turneri]
MDSTGRLLKYDAKTKQVTVLVSNLSFAAGVAVDEEEKFIMVTAFTANRTRKISLQGGGSVIATIQPTPDNIKRMRLNKFWLAAARVVPRMDSSLLPTGVRINGNGTILETVNLEQWYGNKSVSEVREFGRTVSTEFGAAQLMALMVMFNMWSTMACLSSVTSVPAMGTLSRVIRNNKGMGKKMDSTKPTMVLTIDIVMITTTGAVKDLVSLYGPWKQAPTHRRRPNISRKSTMK